MSVKPCTYSNKFKFLLESLSKTTTPEEFKNYVKANFKDSDKVIAEFSANLGAGKGTKKPQAIKQKSLNRRIESQDNSSIESFYIGKQKELGNLQRSFKREIVKRTIYDLDVNKFIDAKHVDTDLKIDTLNKNLVDYKFELINKLRTETGKGEGHESIPVDYTLSGQEFTALIENAKQLYENYNGVKKDSLLDTYTILSKFDDLIKRFAPFIETKKIYKDSIYQFIHQYDYKGPNVEHFYSFSTNEYANAFEQASDLAKILLDVIPEINSSDEPIKNTSIGLSGFTSAMSTVKTALMYPPTGLKDLSKELSKGAKINMSHVLERYINWVTDTSNVDPKRKTYLISKLRSIKKNIYDSNINQDIKDMFTNMFFKNVPITYFAYSYDISKGGLTGENLKNSLANIQKYRLQDVIASSIAVFRKNPQEFNSILKTYGITDDKKGTITIHPDNLSSEATITYKYKNGRYVFETNDDLDEGLTKEIIQNLLSYVLPDDYLDIAQQISPDNTSTFKTFKDILGLIITAGNTDSNLSYKYSKAGLFDFKSYHTLLDPVANILSVLYGSDTISVIKNLEGNGLPTFQLINLAQNVPLMINRIKDFTSKYKERTGRDRFNIHEDNIILQNDGLIDQPLIRSSIKIGENTKSPSELTSAELLHIASVYDFYDKIDTGTIYIQSTTFADKNTHFLIPFHIDQDIDIAGNIYNLKEILQDCIDTGNNQKLEEIYKTLRMYKMDNLVQNILKDWSYAYDRDFSDFNQINKFIRDNKLTVDEISEQFQYKGLDCFENIHYYQDKKSKQILMNETIYNWYETYQSPNKVKARLNKNRINFIKSIFDNNVLYNKFRDPKLWALSQKAGYDKWFNPNSGDMIIAKTKDGQDITKYNLEQFLNKNPNLEITLNPFLEAYFMSDIILSNEYNSLTLGEVYAHPNKNEEGKLYDDEYFEKSEANRLIAQNKRAVIMGATYHPFLQGTKYGVASEINLAVMEDMPGITWNMIGETAVNPSMDGSGISSPLQARMENVSLEDANVGYDKKTIMGDVDPIYGRPTLLKWAVYALTNSRRRLSQGSVASGENLFRKMHNIPIGKEVNIVSYFNKLDKPLYYWDNNTQSWKYIESINRKINKDGSITYYRVEYKTDEKGKYLDNAKEDFVHIFTKAPEDITLYDLDQLFGGAYAATQDENGDLDYSEINLDLLMNIVAEEDLKDKFIAYAVNKSAIKVGAGNINAVSSWTDNSKLTTIRMSTAFGGVQMNADHELIEAEVTEMTQMLSSLIENGNSLDLVNLIYSDIGELVVEALSDFYDAIKSDNPDKLYRVLGEALVDAFLNNDRDTIGLAQSFVTKANQSLQDNTLEFRIPFSAPTINGAFISTIISLINKRGIRRKYAGFAGVLNPSHNYIQYYRVGNLALSYDQLAGRIYRMKEQLQRNDPTNPWVNAKINDFIYHYTLNGKWNPFVTQYKSSNDIDFEDTVIVQNKQTGKTTAIYIDTWEKYDFVKTQLSSNNYNFFNWETRPKNLKQSNTKFTIKGVEYSIYDITSVRVSQYVQNKPSKDLISLVKELSGLDDIAALNYISNYRNTLISTYYPNSNDVAAKAEQDTRTFLKNLEDGKLLELKGLGGLQTTSIIAESYNVEPAEIIIGRKDAAKFGLLKSENVSDVMQSGENFFINKLNDKYNFPDVDNDLYDFVLYTDNGDEILVKVGTEDNIQRMFAKVGGLSKDDTFKIVGDKVYYNDTEFSSANDKGFYTYVDNYGHKHSVITVSQLDRVSELLNSGTIDTYRTNYSNGNWKALAKFNRKSLEENPKFEFDKSFQYDFIKEEAKQFQRNIKRLAKRQYDAFEKSLYLVGARIPTQGMQSYMPMKVIMFTDSKVNDIYVPKAQTWLQGSM